MTNICDAGIKISDQLTIVAIILGPILALSLQRGLDHSRAHKSRQFKRFEKNGLLDIRPDKRFHIVFEKVAHHLSKKEYLKKVGSEAVSRIDQSFEDTSSNYVRSFTLSIAHDDIRNLGGEIAQVFDKYMAKDRTSPDSMTIAQSFVSIFPVMGRQTASTK